MAVMRHHTVLAAVFLLIAPGVFAHEAHETIRVDSVDPGSPAEAAGVEPGDELVRLGGEDVATLDRLRSVLAAHDPGDRLPLVVRREGEPTELELTLDAGSDGRAVMGVRLLVGSGDPTEDAGGGTASCLAWIDETYRVAPLVRELGLDLADDYASVLACVEEITRQVSTDTAVRYCDNFLKGHCQVTLREKLGVTPDSYSGWRTCAQHEVFDRYAMNGDASDEGACRSAFLETCGTNIDAAVAAGRGSPEQREFVECCTADALDPGRGESSCAMIDPGFSRGPCHDRPICVSTTTTEWIRCSLFD
jgi:hypothetical protein